MVKVELDRDEVAVIYHAALAEVQTLQCQLILLYAFVAVFVAVVVAVLLIRSGGGVC